MAQDSRESQAREALALSGMAAFPVSPKLVHLAPHVATGGLSPKPALEPVHAWTCDVIARPVKKTATPLRTPLTKPAWAPSDAQMNVIVDKVRTRLEARDPTLTGSVPPRIRQLDFSDADLTLLDTQLPVPLLDENRAPILHPGTGEPIVLGRGPTRSQYDDLKALRADFEERFPDSGIAWDRVLFDKSALRDPVRIANTPEIEPTTRALRSSALESDHRTFVNTARPGAQSEGALRGYLEARGIPITDVFSIGRAEEDSFGFDPCSLTSGQRKAVLMAAIIRVYGAEHVETSRFIDDLPEFLRPAMELLPASFPRMRFELWGVRHRADSEFRHWPITHYDPALGSFLKPGGTQPLSFEGALQALEHYAVRQAPFEDSNGLDSRGVTDR